MFPQKIGVLRKYKLNHFGARRADWPASNRAPAVRLAGLTDIELVLGIVRGIILEIVLEIVSGNCSGVLRFMNGSDSRKDLVFGPTDEYTMRSTMTQPEKKTRRQMLEEFVAAKPNDAFARYGLAMECATTGDVAGADRTVQGHPRRRIPNMWRFTSSTDSSWRDRTRR